MSSKKLRSKIGMRKEYLGSIEKLEELQIQRTFPVAQMPKAEIRLKILISASVLKTITLAEDLSSVILDGKFFASLSLLRMLFEEVILITFAVSKLKKAASLSEADHVLTRITLGQKTDFGQEERILPYNIVTTLEEAEKYIKKEDASLKGIFDDTYTFISEYVHPNAPSRYHFHKRYGNKMRITNKLITDDDTKMLLNYGCMVLSLYLFAIIPLMNLKIEDLK